MNIDDAAYHTVHDYPGGAAALAPRMGKSASSLSHEVKPPANSTAKLGLRDAQRIMVFTGDLRILQAQAAELGQLCLPMPTVSDAGDQSAEHLSALAREFADVLSDVAMTLADGKVTDNEMARIERSFGEMVAAGQKMLVHLGALNAQTHRPEADIKLRSVA